MDIGNQQRVIIVETEQMAPDDLELPEADAKLVDIAEEEWPLPVGIDSALVR